jgi:hypothetical protein
MAVEYNEFVAQTTNRQTVLNVLRASEREPMHFTSFAIVRGSVRGQGNAELGTSLPSGTAQTILKTINKTTTSPTATTTEASSENTLTTNDNDATLSPKLAIQVSTGTDFDIAVNATDDFYRGILGPLKESVVVHFLRQGFPADLLSHLVIGELRFFAVFNRDGKAIDENGNEWKEGNKKEKYGPVLVAVVKNTPDELDKATSFKEAMDCRELSYVKGSTFADVVYRGTKYEVPLSGKNINSTSGRSSQTISLVQQLLNLHRTSKDLPITPLVRVAN